MKNPPNSRLPAELARARRTFKHWRSTHRPRSRLPKHLWSLAAELARRHGINRTSRTLGLDYYYLKRQTGLATSVKPSQPIPSAQFLELMPAATQPALECTIDCEDAKGTKIRIHLKGPELPDLAALSSGLWRCDR